MLLSLLTAGTSVPQKPWKMEIVFPEQFGDDLTPEALTAWGDRLEQAEKDLVPIQERLDALNNALADGWCPSRLVQGELDHLNNVLTAYHARKYLSEIVQTLDDAEADFAAWETLSEAARDAIIEANERAEADLAARRKAREEASARKKAIYDAARKIGMPLSPALEEALAWVA